MIPSDTIKINGSTKPVFLFKSSEDYAVSGVFLVELEALMRRLGTEQRMSAGEMRDWVNLLFLRLPVAVEV